MNSQVSVYKILHLVSYDFKNNIKSWLYLIALQLVSFIALGFIADAAQYGLVVMQDYFDPTQASYVGVVGVLIAGYCIEIIKKIAAWFLLFMTLQNGLDLAFESSMRGFSVDRSIILPASGLLLMLVTPWVPLIFLLDSIVSTDLFFILLGCLGLLALFLWIRLQFSILHVLEYKAGLVRSLQASFGMTSSHFLWLACMAFIELLGGLFIVSIILVADSILLYFQDFLQPSVFTAIFTTISCLSAVMLLLYFVWFSLIQVHMYREFVDPYVENASCKSCDACEKQNK